MTVSAIEIKLCYLMGIVRVCFLFFCCVFFLHTRITFEILDFC